MAFAQWLGNMVVMSEAAPATSGYTIWLYHNDAWVAIGGGSGTGDVVGPSSATADHFPSFDTTTGKLIKDSGVSASDFATAAQGTDARTPTTHGNEKHSVAYLPLSGGTTTGAVIGYVNDTPASARFRNIICGTADPTTEGENGDIYFKYTA